MKLSIIVPCYNESRNIPLIIEKFNSIIKSKDIEVILVNNGSTDDSKDIINKFLKKHTFLRTHNVPENNGYGFGITSGLELAKGEFIGYTHADMQTDPLDIIKGLDIISQQTNPENCYIKGNRKGRPIFDQFFTIGMSFFESIYLNQNLWDINAQPNIFHKSFFDSIKTDCPKDFSLDLYFLYMAKKNNLEIIRFDVVFPKRIYGESKWNTGLTSKWRFIKRTFDFSVKLKKEL